MDMFQGDNEHRIRSSQGDALLIGLPGKLYDVPSNEPLNWEPTPRRIYDLELRVQLISTGATAAALIPVLGFDLEIGHGIGTGYNMPRRADGLPPMTRYTVPGRGLVLRFTAAKANVYFRMLGLLSAAGTAWTGQLCASVQPARGPLPVVPTETAALALAAAGRHALPMDAREWRIYGADGQPLLPGVASIVLLSVSGGVVATVDASAFAGWSPIPHFAAFFTTTLAVYAGYR